MEPFVPFDWVPVEFMSSSERPGVAPVVVFDCVPVVPVSSLGFEVDVPVVDELVVDEFDWFDVFD